MNRLAASISSLENAMIKSSKEHPLNSLAGFWRIKNQVSSRATLKSLKLQVCTCFLKVYCVAAKSPIFSEYITSSQAKEPSECHTWNEELSF